MKIVRKISATETLEAMKVGESHVIKASLMKITTVRRAAQLLKNRGYCFTTTERGLINEVRVTRTA